MKAATATATTVVSLSSHGGSSGGSSMEQPVFLIARPGSAFQCVDRHLLLLRILGPNHLRQHTLCISV